MFAGVVCFYIYGPFPFLIPGVKDFFCSLVVPLWFSLGSILGALLGWAGFAFWDFTYQYDIAMKGFNYENLEGLAEAINTGAVDNLLDLDWNVITCGFDSCRLKELVLLVDCIESRVVVVRACLMGYRDYLVSRDYEFYLASWDGDCQFREYCELLIDSFGDHKRYCLSSIGTVQCAVDLPGEFCTPYAGELMGRLIPDYCDKEGHWRNGIGLVFISQVAHVLSGLLNIAQKKKWVYFEKIWHVNGLGKAYHQREGRALDAEIRNLFPEYTAF